MISPVSFTEVGGGWVGYRTIGEPSDRVVLFVPTAAGGNLDVMLEHPDIRAFFLRVAEFAQVVMFDRRGTGVSDDVTDRLAPTLEDWTDDALAVLEAVGAERVSLLAHAMGTAPAVLFAAGYPERVDSLVTLNGFARFASTDGYDVGIDEATIERVVALVAERWGEGSVYLLANPGLAEDRELVEWLAQSERNTFGRAAATRAWRTWLSNDVRHVVPSVQARSLVMYGRRRAGGRASRWLAANLPDAEALEFDNRNNDWWYLEGLDHAVTALQEFLTGVRAAPPVRRMLTTVLFTDIVDSTSRAAALGDGQWRMLLDQHDRLSGKLVTEHNGSVVKQTGDGTLATFDGPARAVECARALTRQLASLGIAVRAGLHTGEVEVRQDDVSGMAVHIAARVASLADSDEVLVSRTIPDLVIGSGLQFEPRGPHRLKGVDGEWEISALV